MTPAAFLRWWGGELAALLPRGGGHGKAVRLRLDGDGLQVETDGRPGGRVKLGKAGQPLAGAPLKAAAEAAAEGRPVALEIAPGQALARHIRVARAAESELAGVLSFEIERHTPFRAAEVVFAWRPDPAQDDPEHLGVELVAVPRRILDPLCAGLADHGLTPGEILARPAADRAPVALPSAGEPPPAGARVLLPALVTAALLAVAVLSPLWRVEAAADARAAAVAQSRIAHAAGTDERRAAARNARAVRLLADARAARPTVLATLDAVSALLPDGTWLMRFAMTGAEAVLEGRTQSAVDLVGRLEAAPMVDAVAYAAPVTRDPAGGGERFGFNLTLAGGGR